MAEKKAAAKPRAAARLRRGSSRPPPPVPPIPYAPAEVEEIFRRLHVQRPEPTSELEFRDPFTLLCAVVLSAQSTDVGVNRATRQLFPLAPTPAALAAMHPEAIVPLLQTVSFANTKARNLVGLAQRLLETHGGEVPQNLDALEALPGVGRKTARVVLNTAFHEPLFGVDTHIFRIGNRLKLAPGKTPDEVERNFVAIIPSRYLTDAHHLVLLHGRYVCKARKPDCAACIIADLCRADEKWNDVPAPLVPLPVRGPGLQGTPQTGGAVAPEIAESGA